MIYIFFRKTVDLGELHGKDEFDGASPFKVSISEIIFHPKYNAKEFTTDMYNVALLKLSTPVHISGKIRYLFIKYLYLEEYVN